jgi:iron(III) transport system permease protein
MMIYNTLCKLNGNLENVGQTLGIGRIRMIKDVIIPQTIPTILEMASYFFVNSMMTISAVAFLSNIRTSPLSLMIPQFEAQMLLEASAFVSLMILFTNLLMKACAYFVKKILSRRRVIKNAD